MRIKNLKINDVFRIKNLDVEFSDTDNIICVIEKYKDEDELPFGSHVLDVMESLFLNMICGLYGYGEIQCLCEKYKKNFLISLKGNNELLETTYQGKKMIGQKYDAEETCFFDEDVSKEMQWINSHIIPETLFHINLKNILLTYFRIEEGNLIGCVRVIRTNHHNSFLKCCIGCERNKDLLWSREDE